MKSRSNELINKFLKYLIFTTLVIFIVYFVIRWNYEVNIFPNVIEKYVTIILITIYILMIRFYLKHSHKLHYIIRYFFLINVIKMIIDENYLMIESAIFTILTDGWDYGIDGHKYSYPFDKIRDFFINNEYELGFYYFSFFCNILIMIIFYLMRISRNLYDYVVSKFK